MTDSDNMWPDPDEGVQITTPPGWTFLFRDLIGIGFAVTAGIFGGLAQGAQMVANEFFASARLKRMRQIEKREQKTYRRITREQERQRREMARYLDGMVEAEPQGGES